MAEKLSTGISGIDRKLSGGVQPGSLLAVIAGPATQSEHLLFQLITERPTLYLSTIRQSSAVEGDLAGLSDNIVVKDILGEQSMDNEFVKEMTGLRSNSLSSEDPNKMLDRTYEAIKQVDQQMNVIIDPVNPLEEVGNKDRYREMINTLESKVAETGGLGIFHCITFGGAPSLRDKTLAMSDTVMQLKLVSMKNELQYQLTIPKNRGGPLLLDETEVKFDAGVRLDDTRNI